jgi:hypothetical protein
MRKILLSLIKVKDNEHAEFWVSHLLIIITTIIGVYLAASSGFKIAVEFELVKSDRDSYYQRSAMRDELIDNINQLEKWGKDYTSGGVKNYVGQDAKELDQFVWKTMQFSQGTFEIPTEILSGIRGFYTSMTWYLNKMSEKKGNASFVKEMLKKVEMTKSNLLPKIDTDLAALRQRLLDYKINPDL